MTLFFIKYTNSSFLTNYSFRGVHSSTRIICFMYINKAFFLMVTKLYSRIENKKYFRYDFIIDKA